MGNLTHRDYDNAIVVQDACNLSGVLKSFAEVMEKICYEAHQLEVGTDWKNKHPISVLYASKIAALTGCGVGMNFIEAYNHCQERSKG